MEWAARLMNSPGNFIPFLVYSRFCGRCSICVKAFAVSEMLHRAVCYSMVAHWSNMGGIVPGLEKMEWIGIHSCEINWRQKIKANLTFGKAYFEFILLNEKIILKEYFSSPYLMFMAFL